MPGSAQRRNWSGLVIEQPKAITAGLGRGARAPGAAQRVAAQGGDLALGGAQPLAQVSTSSWSGAPRIRLRSCTTRRAGSAARAPRRGGRGARAAAAPASIAASELRRQWTQVQSTSSIGSSIPCWARNSSTARRHSSSAP